MRDDDTIICRKCGEDCPEHYAMCDLEDGQWCAKCFPETACGQGKHGEGCPTLVFDDLMPTEKTE